MLALLLAACLPHPAPIPVGPIPDDVAVVAIVGDVDGPVGEVLAEADLVVLLDPGPRRKARVTWESAAVASVSVLPLVGYGSVDLGGARLVWLDTSGDRRRRADQMFWLPRVMGDDVPKFVLVPQGPDSWSARSAALDYAPAGMPPLAVIFASEGHMAAMPGDGFGDTRIDVGPLSQGWWRLDLGGDPVLQMRGDGGLPWRWTARDGWQPVRSE